MNLRLRSVSETKWTAFLELKRTSVGWSQMSASDPRRTKAKRAKHAALPAYSEIDVLALRCLTLLSLYHCVVHIVAVVTVRVLVDTVRPTCSAATDRNATSLCE